MAEVDLIIEAISKGFDKVSTDLKKVGEEGAGAGKKSEESSKKFGGFGDTIKNLVGAGALLGLANQLVQFGKQSIMAASDAAEMQSKFNIVFGDVGGRVTQQLQDFSAATGASRFELMGMAATLGDTFKPMGYTADQAGNLSVQMVKLATDLSSFNNIPVAEALQRIQGGLIGNHENLLKFGVLINEASLKEELMRMGADNLTGAQLNQAKVQARLNILVAGTKDAQGDAVRTADGFANSSRALSSAIGDLSVVLGNALLPAATDSVHIFTDLVKQLTTTTTAVSGAYTPAIEAAVDANRLLLETNPEEAFKKLSEALGVLQNPIQELPPALQKIADISPGAAVAIYQLGDAAVYFSGAEDELKAKTMESLAAIVDFSDGNILAGRRLEDVSGGLVKVSNGYIYLNGQVVGTIEELHKLTRATAETNQRQLEQARTAALMAQVQEEIADTLPRVSDAEDELNDKRAQAANLLTEEEANLAAYHAEMVRGAAADAEADAAAQRAIISSRDRAAAQAELTEQIRVSSLEMVNAAAVASGEYFNAAVQATDQTFNFGQSMYDAAVAQGASATQLALLTTQSLGYTEAQTQAFLADALRQAKTQELTQAYLDHKISLAEATESMRLFELEVNDLAAAQLTAAQNTEAQTAATSPLTDGMNNSALAAENLANKLGNLPTNIEIGVHTNYTESGTPPTIPGGAFGPDNNKVGPGAPGGGNAGAAGAFSVTPNTGGGLVGGGGARTFIFNGFTPTEIINLIRKENAGEARKIREHVGSGKARR